MNQMESPFKLEGKPPAALFIIRHGEKDDGDGLSRLGMERAKLLPTLFSRKLPFTQFPPIKAIYYQDSNPPPSTRPKDTIQPLAAELKVPTIAWRRGEKPNKKKNKPITEINAQVKALYDDVMGIERKSSDPSLEGSSVVLCWDHTIISEIAHQFLTQGRDNGANDERVKNAQWPEGRYDVTFVIDMRSGMPVLSKYPQNLLAGDQDNVFDGAVDKNDD